MYLVEEIERITYKIGISDLEGDEGYDETIYSI